ncbi:DUF3291 domain-containing protein [Streptomyces sp. NPDC058247]|uniref:DUF3291 domain-containing protein n=1 Tax=Streptomyces sp. NPDC058247 TaxID=3346401 RepID=UPI0036E52D3F
MTDNGTAHRTGIGTRHELAQVNIGRLAAPLHSEQLRAFAEGLDPVNAAADASDGFVWRLKGDTGDATDIRIFDDAWLLVNMSVWRDTDSLTAFIYQGQHREILARRREFFERLDEAVTALWWVPAGHRPTVEEAEERLVRLRRCGPTPYAFNLRTAFPAGDAEPEPELEPELEPEPRFVSRSAS